MKGLFLGVVLLISFTLSAKEVTSSVVNAGSTETVLASHIDKKKARKNKRVSKRRKKACNNWAKRSYAG
jgi:hypothetical protein